MPYKYNPFTGNLDFYEASAAGTISTINTDSGSAAPAAGAITITGGTGISTSGAGSTITVILDTPVTVATGGTGATTAAGARTALGLAIGTNVQAWDAQLDDIAALAITKGNLIASDGVNWAALGVGTNGQVLTADSAQTTGLIWATPTAGTVTSVSGTTNRISSTGGATPVIDIDAAYVGQASITTLGTITTGVWTGTAIGETAGGTGQTTYTTGDVLYASGANTLAKLGVASNGDVLTLAAGVPSWATPTVGTVTSVSGTTNRISSTGGATPVIDIDAAYVGQTSITTLGTVATGTWEATDVGAAHGGTGRSSHTAYAVICGGTTATAAQQSIASVGTSGQVLTSNGAGALPTFQAAAGGGLTWNEETGTSATMSVNNGYIANNAALVTLTLPTTAAVGDVVRVTGKGAGGWRVAQNASEIIHFLGTDTTTGATGRLDSTNTYDSVELVCIVANTEWNVISSMGNITIT